MVLWWQPTQRWLREHENILPAFAALQVILAFVMIITGGYAADHVQGFQTLFEMFGASERIPYYILMYYGVIGQAAYGAALVLLTITSIGVLDYNSTTHNNIKAAITEMATTRSAENEVD
ncbi:Hypothetical protein PENO1_109060 [Penicillium occitanis (nom. inval.)]|nr:Hypothetical protein PENO1_109060 [Penicillium occitanis (nom. inval.)]PCG88775.1 hypothetical protein PENOC_109450 [Penicillium occitanis (nom. inval.)]